MIVSLGPNVESLYATEEDEIHGSDGEYIVGEIQIDGLRKTKEQIVLDIVGVKPGDPIDDESIQSIEDELIKSDLFAEVSVDPIPREDPTTLDGADTDSPTVRTVDLSIEVDEKWTLVPIPFFSSGGDGFSGGLILIESNLLGRNKQLISAGFAGTDGASGFFLFVDPSVFRSRFRSTTSASFGTSDIETVRPDDELIRSYSVEQLSAGFGLGYKLTPELTIGTRLGVARWRIDDFEPGLDTEEIDDGSYLEPEVSIEYERTRPIDVLLFGPEASIDARWLTIEGGWEIRSRTQFSVPVFETHRLRMLASGGYGSMPVIGESSVSARDGFRTLPYQKTNADEWISGALLYDFPVLSRNWGALVLSHYWEGGVYDTEVLSPQEFYGPGGGFRVYIRQVAIPAVGLDIAYNLANPSWVFSFTVGAQM